MRAKTTSALAGLLCMLLSACSSTGSDGMSMNRSGENYGSTAGSGQSGTSGSGGSSDTSSMGASGASGASGTSGTSGSGSISAAGRSDMGSTGTSTGSSDSRTSTANNASSMDGSKPGASIASATVQSIEPVPRGTDQGSGEMQSGSSGTAGNTAGSSGNTMYRVTLRLDDGSTRAIMQGSQPTYQIGDRVKMSNGQVQSY